MEIELCGNTYRRDDGGVWGLVVSGNPGEDWEAGSPTLSAALDEIERLRNWKVNSIDALQMIGEALQDD